MESKSVNWSQIKFISRRIYRRTIRVVGSRLYVDKYRGTRNSILVAGTGRSGTTWLADIIAAQVPCRIMFEPFNSRKVPEFGRFNYFHYMHPEKQDSELYSFAFKIMTGNIRDRWINRQNELLFPKFRIIKEIRANLFLKWLHDKFPEVPLLFIIRHPCAVVLSHMQLEWATDADIAPFLQQEELIADHLSDKLDVIERAKTDEEKYAIIWSVSNLVPLTQFQPGELKIIFYENLCTQPEIELPRAFEAIGQEYRPSSMKQVVRPSTTAALTSAIVTGGEKISRWKQALTPLQIDNILAIVEEFGLGELYGDSLTPKNFAPFELRV